jgi:hypothetical protein
MTSVTDAISHAVAVTTDAVSEAVDALEKGTQQIVQAVVEVAKAVSEALQSDTWTEFFSKLQEVFQALDRLRTVRAQVNFKDLPANASKREKERVEEFKQRIELAMAEGAALKKLVLDEARRRQQAQASEQAARITDNARGTITLR